MTNERKRAIEEATELGIVFTNNISTKNLKVLIAAEKESISNSLKSKPDETPKEEETKEKIVEPTLKVEDEKEETPSPIKEDNKESKENTLLPLDETPKEEETYDDEIKIKRVSVCGNYRTKIIGVKEAARRSGVSEEDVKSSIQSGAAVNGWTFKEVE